MTDALSDHSIRLRDVADADDPRCPDDLDGCLVVTYTATHDANATYTEHRAVSARLPYECLVAFEDGRVDVADLDGETRQWLQAASARYGNEIDFDGTSTTEVAL